MIEASPPSDLGFGPAEQDCAEALIKLALAEDLGDEGDLTSLATIPPDARGSARLVARRPGVVAGLPVVAQVTRRTGLPWFHPRINDADHVAPGMVIASIAGTMQDLLAFERTALNFLQRLSGIATLTSRFVVAVAGTQAVILDTRKTTPGWRVLEKYAVRCGGGRNHRMGLFDAVLIKDNHLAWLAETGDPIGRAIAACAGRRRTRSSWKSRSIRSRSSTGRSNAIPTSFSSTISGPRVSPRPCAGATRRPRTSCLRRRAASRWRPSGPWRGAASIGSASARLTHSAPALDIGLDFESKLGL